MLMNEQEIMDINQNAEFDSAIGYARAIESAVLEKLKAQEPVAWMNSKRDMTFTHVSSGPLPLPLHRADRPGIPAF